MIYAYDQNIQMPVKDLYDTQMMAIAINAAKDMYDNARLEIKDFNKLYGDFITPIAADQDWYDKNVTGAFLKEINNMYAQGIDPLRSAEGRSRIARLINSVPTGTIGMMKANAALYEKRLAEEAKLGDRYNKNMDIALYGDPTQFSTVGPDGKLNSFNYAPPSAYQTIDELIEPVIKNIKPIYDEAYTKSKNDGNDWYTITKDRMMLAVNDNMSDILATPSGRFLYLLAKKEAKDLGKPELAGLIFKNKIANRLSDHEYIEPKANPFRLADYRHRLAQQLAAMNHANALARQRERLQFELARKNTPTGSGGGTKGSDKEQYTDSEWQFRRLTTGILGKTSVGRSLGIGNAAQFDYDLMSGDAVRRAQQELIGKYYVNDTSNTGGMVRKPGSKGVNFSNYQPTKVDLNKAIGTGKMSWDLVQHANSKYIDAISADLSSKKFMRGIGREPLGEAGMKQHVYMLPSDIDRIYTKDYIALSSSGMNRPADLLKARQQNEQVRRLIQGVLDRPDAYAAMVGAGKIVGMVSAADGQWHTFAKINLATVNPDGTKNNLLSPVDLSNLELYIDLGIDSYKNPNYGQNGDYSTNLTIDANGAHEDLRNIWDANVNKELRVAAPNVGSTIAIPEMYDPEEYDWEDYEDYSQYYN